MKRILTSVAAMWLLASCTTSPKPGIGTDWIDRTPRTPAASLTWRGVASSSTGSHLVAVATADVPEANPGIWTSTDSGATWTNRTAETPASGELWAAVASDSTGTYLVAVAEADAQWSSQDVWTSADAGATWTKRTRMTSTSNFVEAPLVASDSTGTHLVVADGDIWTSADSGATWSDQAVEGSTKAESWVGLASDSTGAHLVGGTAYSDIWTSSDFGATWTNRTAGTPASGQQWAAVASDSTGANLVAVSLGNIWTSADAGATWVNRTAGTSASGHNWTALASDATGAHLVAASSHDDPSSGGNDIWASDDEGATWIDATAGTAAADQQWGALASDATGARIVAVSDDPGGLGFCCEGDIWTN